MMTIHVVAVGRTWVTSWRWYKVCSHRRNPVIIDKYRNHIVQRVKVACIRSGPGSQWQGTSVDVSYSIKESRMEENQRRKHRRSERCCVSTGLEHGRLHDAVGAKCGETLTVTIG